MKMYEGPLVKEGLYNWAQNGFSLQNIFLQKEFYFVSVAPQRRVGPNGNVKLRP
jgi:hypothetical protein